MALHLFHGTDYFRLGRAWRTSLARQGVDPAALIPFDGTDHPPGLAELYHAAFSGSLFGPAPGVIVHNAAAWLKAALKPAKGKLDPADLSLLHDLTHGPAEIPVVLVELNGTLPRTPAAVWKELQSGAGERLVQCDTLKFIPFGKNPELENCIRDYAKEWKLPLEPAAIQALAWRCGSDLGVIWSELSKYADWAAAHPQDRVTATLIERETPPVAEVFIFDLIDAIATRQQTKALQLMHLVMQGGEPAPRVLVLIHRQYRLMFRTLLEGGGTDLPARLGVAPWQARKVEQAARGYRRGHLPRVLRLLVETDQALKSSRLPPGLAMEKLVLELTGV